MTQPAGPGVTAPVAVVMLALNEGHCVRGAFEALRGWAQEVFLVDSYSRDDTVDVALEYGVHVVQRAFRGFGDQWNFALRSLPILAPWTLKLDPDERLSQACKDEIARVTRSGTADAYVANVRLNFMGRPLHHRLSVLRLWRTGTARFTDVSVNEHAVVDGTIHRLHSNIEHLDSPSLEHWWDKQNRYSTSEALLTCQVGGLKIPARLLGSSLERRMWLKERYWRVPFRHSLLFVYNYFLLGAWKAGWPGYVWARLRSDVMRMIEYKRKEIALLGRLPGKRVYGTGQPHPHVQQYE